MYICKNLKWQLASAILHYLQTILRQPKFETTIHKWILHYLQILYLWNGKNLTWVFASESFTIYISIPLWRNQICLACHTVSFWVNSLLKKLRSGCRQNDAELRRWVVNSNKCGGARDGMHCQGRKRGTETNNTQHVKQNATSVKSETTLPCSADKCLMCQPLTL